MNKPQKTTPLVDGDTSIEDLVSRYPRSVRFLMEKGIKCLACGEPIWGTVASSARAKGFSEVQIQALVQELNKFISEG